MLVEPANPKNLELVISNMNCVLHGSPMLHSPMTEAQYEEFVTNNPWPAGTLITFSANKDVTSSVGGAGLQVILKIQENLNDMVYSHYVGGRNEPRPYLMSSVPMQHVTGTTWTRWESNAGWRSLTKEEETWVANNDLLQAKLKAITEAFKAGRIS
jgi:hypothetical protein